MIRRGATLIELLITITILGIVVTLVGTLFTSTGQFNRDEQVRIDVGESTSRVLGPLNTLLREGKQILASGVVNSTTYTTGTDTVVFTLPSLDNNGATQTSPDDTAVITLDATNPALPVIRQLVSPASGTFRPSSNTIAVTDVKDFYIRYTSDDVANSSTVSLTVQITKTVNNRPFTRTNVLYGTLRNHP